MLCPSCNADAPSLATRHALTVQRKVRKCGPCCVRECVDVLIPQLKRAGFACWCAYMQHIGADRHACIFCSKHRRARLVCPCRDHPRLPGVASGGCSECDPTNPRRPYDRCKCALLKDRETPINTGDGVAVCLACWVAWAALDYPWWVRYHGQTGQHADAMRGPFYLQHTGSLSAVAVASELRALVSVRRNFRMTFEVRDTEVWCRMGDSDV